MIKPKRGYPRAIHASKEVIVKFCENPKCGAKLDSLKARQGQKYCDRVCRWEHERMLAIERRPKDIRCAFCNKAIDPMRANPSHWAKSETHFCDGICADAHRRQSGHYTRAAKIGNAKVREYKEKHGQVHNYERRSAKVSENNKKAPPKSKHFVREGKVWGYDVKFYPHEDGQSYRVSVAELEELGVLYAKTVKEGLKLVREKILELRVKESSAQIS